jgi:HD-like signal output (HDOD) protein
MADEDGWQWLLVRAKDGQLSEQDLSQIASVLKDPLRQADDEERRRAVSVAGEYLRNTWNDKLFEALLEVATNEHNSHENRVAVILALARAVGGVDQESAAAYDQHRNAFDQAFKKLLGQDE